MPVTERDRGRAGVICNLVELDSGGLRISIDDAERSGSSTENWTQTFFVTRNDYPGGAEQLEALSEAELADFGLMVLARLLAWHKQGGSKP